MMTFISPRPAEHELALSPFPSVARLATGFTLISIGFFCWGFSGSLLDAIGNPCILAAGFLLVPKAEWQRRFTARDGGVLLAGLGVLAVLVLALHGKAFPADERFFRHPGFLVPLWALCCSGYIWRWRKLRRDPRASPNGAGAA